MGKRQAGPAADLEQSIVELIAGAKYHTGRTEEELSESLGYSKYRLRDMKKDKRLVGMQALTLMHLAMMAKTELRFERM